MAMAQRYCAKTKVLVRKPVRLLVRAEQQRSDEPTVHEIEQLGGLTRLSTPFQDVSPPLSRPSRPRRVSFSPSAPNKQTVSLDARSVPRARSCTSPLYSRKEEVAAAESDDELEPKCPFVAPEDGREEDEEAHGGGEGGQDELDGQGQDRQVEPRVVERV